MMKMKDEILTSAALVLVFVAGVLFAILALPELTTPEVERHREVEHVEWNVTEEPLEDGLKVYIVGTTVDRKGVVSPAWVRAEKGTGKILVDIENLFFWVDIQHSIRTASSYAKEYLDIERKEHDLTYSIALDFDVIGGPSAGSQLTVATMAALKNSTIRNDIVMTGTIEPDGRVGRVGGILEKAKAAEEEGFEKFLLPYGQAVQVKYEQVETCREVRGFEICRTRYVEEKTDIREEVEIEIVEIAYIEEALEHFLG